MKVRLVLLVVLLWVGLPAFSQVSDGDNLFNETCALCHVQQAGEEIPGLEELESMSANGILRTMTDGAMKIQASTLSREQQIAVAEFLSKDVVIEGAVSFETGMCADLPPITSAEPGMIWSGWGNDEKNSRFQLETGGLHKENISQLKLKWAFGIPDVVQVRAQPAIYGDRLFMGSLSGVVFALNSNTGCTYWTFKAESGIRTAMSIADIEINGQARTAVFFNDLQANVYALDAETGEQIWSVKYDDHPAALGTGAIQVFNGVIYAPSSGLSEEAIAFGNPDYECCTFRGSISALDAATGEELWKTYTLPEPEFVRVLENGKDLIGPAGGAVWNTPTVDVKRNRLYIATGNAYTEPEVNTSNAIIALDLDDGEIVWINQVLQKDIWSGGCYAGLGGNPDNPGCVKPLGPDFDFSASPVLTTTADGKDLIVATQKSGLGYGFDPDDDGRLLWTYRWGVGAAAGGVYGTSSDGEKAYFAVADNETPAPGGIHGVDLISGERIWFTPPQDKLCREGPGCTAVQSAAVTSMPGVVFSTSADGGIRAYDSDTGDVIWVYNANRSFETINGVQANGGSLDGPGVVISNGMVFVTAGNGGPFGRPGNVLLAFGLE